MQLTLSAKRSAMSDTALVAVLEAALKAVADAATATAKYEGNLDEDLVESVSNAFEGMADAVSIARLNAMNEKMAA